ncbi:MAG: hypothetical protein QM622_03340 [Microbacterium sp.]
MSGLKPILREAREAVVDAARQLSDKLPLLTHNIDDHLDDIVRQVKARDKFPDKPDLADTPAVPHKPGPGESSGPVVFYDPKAGATPAQQAQIQAYVEGSNAALRDGYLAPNGRVSRRAVSATTRRPQPRRNAPAGRTAVMRATCRTRHGPAAPNHTRGSTSTRLSTKAWAASRGDSPVGYRPTEFIYGGVHPT